MIFFKGFMQIFFEKAKDNLLVILSKKKNKLNYKKILKIVGVMAPPSKRVFFCRSLR